MAGLDVERPEDTTQVRASDTFVVHPIRPGFRGEPVYFYRAAMARGVARLIGHADLRFRRSVFPGQYDLTATVSFSDPGHGYVDTCVRHAVLPDMGVPFTDRACGRRTLHV